MLLFIPCGCLVFLKYACTQTKYHKGQLLKAALWSLAAIKLDIIYANTVLISRFCIYKLFNYFIIRSPHLDANKFFYV